MNPKQVGVFGPLVVLNVLAIIYFDQLLENLLAIGMYVFLGIIVLFLAFVIGYTLFNCVHLTRLKDIMNF